MTTNHDYVKDFLRGLKDRSTCKWCKHPKKPIYMVELCRRCYDIRGKINRFRKEIDEYKKEGEEIPLPLDFLYRVAQAMEKDAKFEGQMYGQLWVDDITGLKLEHEFSSISEGFVREDLYNGFATLFNSWFTPNQKKILFYLLSLMSRANLRRTRWKHGLNSHPTMTK